MMKLLVLSFYYHPDLKAGAFRTTALIEQLLRAKTNDVQIDVITTLPDRYTHYTGATPKLEHYPGLRIRRIALPSYHHNWFGQAIAYLYFIYKVKRMVNHEEYKVIYTSSSRLFVAILGAWIADKQKSTLYLDLYGLFLETINSILPAGLAKVTRPLWTWIERWTISKAQHVNVISRGCQGHIEQYYPSTKLSYMTHGIDKDVMEYSFKSCSQASDQFTVLYAGHLGADQGLDRIIPKLAKLLEGCAHFKIIGEGNRKKSLEMAVQLAHCTNVEFLPPHNRSELLEAYEQADILFLHFNGHHPFRKNLPSKIFEYAATGKPIWAGVNGYAAEFIRAEIDNAIVFPPGDAEKAVKEISKLNFGVHERNDFVKKYQQEDMMQVMANELMNYIQE